MACFSKGGGYLFMLGTVVGIVNSSPNSARLPLSKVLNSCLDYEPLQIVFKASAKCFGRHVFAEGGIACVQIWHMVTELRLGKGVKARMAAVYPIKQPTCLHEEYLVRKRYFMKNKINCKTDLN